MSFPQPDLSYMKPPKAASQIVHPDKYIVDGNPPKYSRMVYNEVPYLPYEETKIREFKEDISKSPDIQLPADWLYSDYLKVLQCCDFKKKLWLTTLKAHLQWRADPLSQQLHAVSLPILERGVIYTFGRDRQYRPVLILNAFLIDPKRFTIDAMCQAISYFLGQVVKILMLPYFIENWIMIIETNKLGISGLPVSALGKIIGNMQTNFCGRLDKMYILNPSTGINFLWNTLSGFVDPVTRQKIGFLQAKNIKQIQEKVDPNQLEKKYGGTRDDVTQFWPPVNIDPKVDEEPEKKEVQNQIIMMEEEPKLATPVVEEQPQEDIKEPVVMIVQDDHQEQQPPMKEEQLEQEQEEHHEPSEEQQHLIHPPEEEEIQNGQQEQQEVPHADEEQFQNIELSPIEPRNEEVREEQKSMEEQFVPSHRPIGETAQVEEGPNTETLVHDKDLVTVKRVEETHPSTRLEGPVTSKGCCTTCNIF